MQFLHAERSAEGEVPAGQETQPVCFRLVTLPSSSHAVQSVATPPIGRIMPVGQIKTMVAVTFGFREPDILLDIKALEGTCICCVRLPRMLAAFVGDKMIRSKSAATVVCKRRRPEPPLAGRMLLICMSAIATPRAAAISCIKTCINVACSAEPVTMAAPETWISNLTWGKRVELEFRISSSADVSPFVMVVPAPKSTQAVRSAFVVEPASHDRHCPTVEKVLPRQGLQAVRLIFGPFPASHNEHVVDEYTLGWLQGWHTPKAE